MLIMSDITQEEYDYLKNFDFNTQQLSSVDRTDLLRIYNRIYNTKRKPTSCVDCWIEILFLIKKAFDASKSLYEKKNKKNK